jgi:O-acetylhomoserine (thiol)-lyase
MIYSRFFDQSDCPPTYPNIAYEFNSAGPGASLFNLETPGVRYSRIANLTTDVLEKRIAQLEGGVSALKVASQDKSPSPTPF